MFVSSRFCWAITQKQTLCHEHLSCEKHSGYYDSETWRKTFLDSGLVANLHEKPEVVRTHLSFALLHKRVKLTKEEFQRPVFTDPITASSFAYFIFSLPKYNVRFRREWNPLLWDATVRQYWTWLASNTPPGLRLSDQVNVKWAAALINSPGDLLAFFAQLRGVWKYVLPQFLATRPPYMPDHGDQAEPTDYFPLFEALFAPNHSAYEAIATMLPSEIDALFEAYSDFPVFSFRVGVLRARWNYEAQRVWLKRRTTFCRALKEDVIAEAMHPRRIARLLDQYGWEALMEMS
jgi:hypothetical protein